ncbi:MAG: sigma-70 family RNA polymerase sigma factor [Planctomycetota bacterium]
MLNDLPQTSLSLLERVQEKNETAWANLCEIYGPAVYGWARRRGLQPDDASDVVQSTFQTVAEKITTWKPGRFRYWLWTIFRSRLMDFYRSRKNQPNALGGSDAHSMIEAIESAPPERKSEEGRDEIRQTYQRVLKIVGKTIDEKHWQAFLRVAIHGDSPADVAADLGVSVWTVYKCKARVLQRLTRELEGLDWQIDLQE